MTAAVTRPEFIRAVASPVITDEQLRALTADERSSLARRLAVLAAEATPAAPPRRRWFLAAVVAGCVSLVGWIVLLSQTLPQRYVVGHWDAAWLGFDVILLLSLAAVGWTAWRRPAAAPFASLSTAVLLLCDAWFDVATANGAADMAFSVALAGGLELPLAAAMIFLAYRHVRRMTGAGD